MNNTHKTNKILVFGASGHIGFATLKALAQRKIQATAGVRDPSKSNLKELDSKYINIIQADMGQNQEELAALLKNYNSVFIIMPTDKRRVEISINAIRAAKQANVEYILLVTIPESRNQDTIFGRQYTPVEEEAKASGLNYGLLKLPVFMENTLWQTESIAKQNLFQGPIKGTTKYALVSSLDAGIAAAEILSNPHSHINKTHWITSDFASNNDLAQSFSEILQRDIKYVDATREGFRKSREALLEEWVLNGALEHQDLIEEGNSELSLMTEDFFKLTGRKPETIKEWIKRHSAEFTTKS